MSPRVTPSKRRTRRRISLQSLKKRKAGNASEAQPVAAGRVLAPATPRVSQEDHSAPVKITVATLPHLPLALQHPELKNEKTITVKEAAFRLKKSEDAVYLWLRTGRLHGWQPGGRGCAILVSEGSVEAALSSMIVCA